MTTRRWILVAAISVVVIGLLGAGVATGVHCSGACGGAGPPSVEIDAGPTNERAEELLEQAERDAERKREIVEREHREAIERLNEEERAELERVRALPAEDLERWLERFDSDLRSSRSSP